MPLLVMIIIMLVISLITFWAVMEIIIEDHCIEYAKSIVKDKWNSQYLPATEEEKWENPKLDFVPWGYREQKKCERSKKPFIIL